MKKLSSGDITKKKIIHASKKLFYQYGYKNTKFQMISNITHKPISLINYHFPVKRDILIVIMKNFIKEIYDFVNNNTENDYLLKLFICNNIYYNLLNYDTNTIRFYNEILNIKDKVIEPYEIFNILYHNIIKEKKMTQVDALLKKISIFGSNKELVQNYYKGSIDIDLDTLIDLINRNTCNLLGISYLTINKYHKVSKDFSFDYSQLKLFNY